MSFVFEVVKVIFSLGYDTLSYSDYLGNFVVDGEMLYDIPGEFARTYPYKVDEFWPDRKMTLIVKDGQAKVFVAGPEKDTGSFANSFRQPSQMVSMWTYALDDNGYAGGQIGLYMYAHMMTFFNLTITDLSDDANLPSGYCDGTGSCLSSGACVAVAASDVRYSILSSSYDAKFRSARTPSVPRSSTRRAWLPGNS